MDPAQRYREVQVRTSSQEDLLLLLLDGGVRFTEGALLEMEKGEEEDQGKRSDQLIRAQKIILELLGALSPSIGLEPYNNLMQLYQFIFQRLFEGNTRGDQVLISEALQMYKRVREMWGAALEMSREEKVAPAQKRSGSSVSWSG